MSTKNMKYHIDKAHIKSMMKEKKRKTDDYIDQYLSTLQHVTLRNKMLLKENLSLRSWYLPMTFVMP